MSDISFQSHEYLFPYQASYLYKPSSITTWRNEPTSNLRNQKRGDTFYGSLDNLPYQTHFYPLFPTFTRYTLLQPHTHNKLHNFTKSPQMKWKGEIYPILNSAYLLIRSLCSLNTNHGLWLELVQTRNTQIKKQWWGRSSLFWQLVARHKALRNGSLGHGLVSRAVTSRVRHRARADAGRTDAGCRKLWLQSHR